MHCVFMQVIVNIFNCTHNSVLNTVYTITSVNILCKISMGQEILLTGRFKDCSVLHHILFASKK